MFNTSYILCTENSNCCIIRGVDLVIIYIFVGLIDYIYNEWDAEDVGDPNVAISWAGCEPAGAGRLSSET